MRHGGQSPMDLDSVIESKHAPMRPNNALQLTGGALLITTFIQLSKRLPFSRR